jgi:hypothetical protein
VTPRCPGFRLAGARERPACRNTTGHDASREAFKTLLLAATLVYFVSGVVWMRESEKRRRSAGE